jgi:hypothetical protein
MADPIVIIGAGLSGLSAALQLEAAGESCLIFESAKHVGGKLETTVIDDAYRIDRGFQVLLPSYPELKKFKNLNSELQLQFFNLGARLETEDGSILMASPLQHPSNFFLTAFGEYGSFKDKLLVIKLLSETLFLPPEKLLSSASGTTIDFLRNYGFSETIVNSFWKPFFSGIFLESELQTSAGFFKYLTRMFVSSPVAVPNLGIGELPKWMSQRLKQSEIRLSTEVISIHDNVVELAQGQKIRAKAVISDTTSTRKSEGHRVGSVTSFWFKSPEAPYEGAWLSLVSRSPKMKKLINHVAVLSNVSRAYAIKGDALICVNVIGTGPEVNLQSVLVEAARQYGRTVNTWTLLREDRITKAFPLYHDRSDFDTPSQQGALERGKLFANQILKQL